MSQRDMPGRIKWNHRHELIFGLQPGTFDGRTESFRKLIHPDDRHRMTACIESAIRKRERYEITVRICLPDSEIRYVTGHGRAQYNDAGEAVLLMGTATDTTDHFLALRESEYLKAKAEIENAMKTDYILKMSDEIRTPLSSIMGFVDVALDNVNCPEDVRGNLSLIQQNSAKLLDVANSISNSIAVNIASADLSPAYLSDGLHENILPLLNSEILVSLRGLKIIVADDCADLRLLYGHILEAAFAEVILCENGIEALEACEETKPDLILIDMKMPRLDGYEAVPILRQRGFQGPIIAITAHSLRSERNKCLLLGCDDFLAKPVNAKILVRTLYSQVERYNLAMQATNTTINYGH